MDRFCSILQYRVFPACEPLPLWILMSHQSLQSSIAMFHWLWIQALFLESKVTNLCALSKIAFCTGGAFARECLVSDGVRCHENVLHAAGAGPSHNCFIEGKTMCADSMCKDWEQTRRNRFRTFQPRQLNMRPQGHLFATPAYYL